MHSDEIRKRFLQFFERRGHTIVPSSPLVPEADPSVLFTTAGMQQFKPYYTAPENAEKDFHSKNTTSSQKCVRTGDIDEVGDNTHLTFFEMLGNFSFGGYGKREAITYGHDFITKELGLQISYVTFFKGNDSVPRDSESEAIWKELGVADIREDGTDVFWGPTGDSGPCGPTTEIYCKNAAGQDVEIWNIVFNEYFSDGPREKLDKGEATLKKLPTFGIDTGMGLERLLATVQKKESVFETDVFEEIFSKINEFTTIDDAKAKRIVADHVRTAVFMIADGVTPSNEGRGYVLRRLLRRAIRFADVLKMKHGSLFWIAKTVVDKYAGVYQNLTTQSERIGKEIDHEESKFRETLERGMKEFEKGTDPFVLFTTYGFPIELTLELAKENGKEIDLNDFESKMREHQKLSQTASAGMFKGGLANHEPETIKLHTAHHLVLAALQEVLGKSVKQRGSNITEERLRIDFAFDRKMTDEEKQKVEALVNDWIARDLAVVRKEMSKDEAEKLGAEMEFGAKYGDTVSVYFIQDENGNHISKEFCGGPHVEHTGVLGHFKLQKEEASSQGVRRIKAVLQ